MLLSADSGAVHSGVSRPLLISTAAMCFPDLLMTFQLHSTPKPMPWAGPLLQLDLRVPALFSLGLALQHKVSAPQQKKSKEHAERQHIWEFYSLLIPCLPLCRDFPKVLPKTAPQPS